MRPSPRGAPDGERRIPTYGGVIAVVGYLLVFHYGSQAYWARHVAYFPLKERIAFLLAATAVLAGALRLPLSSLYGRFDVPGRGHPRLFLTVLTVALVWRLAIKVASQSIDPRADMAAMTATGVVLECIVAPLNEELMFRGLVLTSLAGIFERHRPLLVLLSAAVFSSIHDIHDLEQQVSTFALGTLLGALFVRTRSVTSCMLAHVLFNTGIFWRLPALHP